MEDLSNLSLSEPVPSDPPARKKPAKKAAKPKAKKPAKKAAKPKAKKPAKKAAKPKAKGPQKRPGGRVALFPDKTMCRMPKGYLKAINAKARKDGVTQGECIRGIIKRALHLK